MSMVTGSEIAHGYFARISGGRVESFFSFPFNPTEDERIRSVEYAFTSSPGSPQPVATFKHIGGEEMTIELLLDATDPYYEEWEGVTAMLAELESYTQPDISKFTADLGQFIPPPQVRYGMGNEYWDVVIPRISIRTVRRNRRHEPTRAYVTVEMRAIFTDISAISSRLQRLRRFRDMVIIEGM